MLAILIDKMTTLEALVGSLKVVADATRDDVSNMKADLSRIDRDQKVIKEALETTNNQLLGRIEQLTVHYERLVGARRVTVD
ncbi:hypothetical protein N825_34880 [Skermanella stibiiresistens SB22]|uniref:Uncharacterized protein n=1 Tax=Skermanella stibiiresistens SB22 TaxID=1385369 RepID=W9H3P7_9PROT|nr:hypothetical protein [Skermanella stibiiresistens]EWY40654.1 hypothetical protein N825_34880 [Skermanella stibiiresistens SB22]